MAGALAVARGNAQVPCAGIEDFSRCDIGQGIGTVKDPRTGRWLDETRYLIEEFDWLSAADKKLIFEDNARKVFNIG